ncbi:hypothetical protein GCM10010411_27810 [Actinomadura fulvescens]|uniref:Uncharacterized protein n=1 Tax=Actinomadura fulvescens TaxID=46160 RepID=A0ABP6BZQ8_9ACTN
MKGPGAAVLKPAGGRRRVKETESAEGPGHEVGRSAARSSHHRDGHAPHLPLSSDGKYTPSAGTFVINPVENTLARPCGVPRPVSAATYLVLVRCGGYGE